MTDNRQYPLIWPMGWPRTNYPKHSKFRAGSAYSEGTDIMRQLKLMKASNVVISSNMRYRADGLPYVNQNVHDSGIAVYFDLQGEQQCIPCDRWSRLEDNLRAIAKTIEALRGIERWGAKEMVTAAFRGFKALPESTIVTPYESKLWYEVLEVSAFASIETVKAAYRSMLLKHHPDQGGDINKFNEIQEAYKEALER